MEFASWSCVTSSQIDIVTAAQRCICLLSIIEHNQAFPRRTHFSRADIARHAAVLETMGGPHLVIGGRNAIQKRIRQLVGMMTRPTPVHVMVFHETMARFSQLTQQVERSSQNQRKDYTTSEHMDAADQLQEWQNTMYMVAVGARLWMEEREDVFPEHITPLLPPSLQGPRRRPDIVHQFLEEVLRLLCSQNIVIRQSAKEALGNELNFKVVPTLFKHLNT